MDVSETVFNWIIEPHLESTRNNWCNWQSLDWQQARFIIQVHGLAPLLYSILTGSGCAELLPPSLKQYLHDQYVLNELRIRKLQTNLSAIMAAAEKESLRVLPLKGSLLISQYYQDPALRPMADIDLLVRGEDEAELHRLLGSLDYSLSECALNAKTYRHKRDRGPLASTCGEHPDNPISVEVHTGIHFNLWRLKYDITVPFWTNSDPAATKAPHSISLNKATLLLHLLCHAGKHLFEASFRMIHLYDISLVGATMDDQDWMELLQATQFYRVERLIVPPLIFARRYLRFELPMRFETRLVSETPPRLCSLIENANLVEFSHARGEWALQNRLKWFYPGRELAEAVFFKLAPNPKSIKASYPDWVKRHSLPTVYLLHGLHAILWPLLNSFGLSHRHLRLRRMIKENQ